MLKSLTRARGRLTSIMNVATRSTYISSYTSPKVSSLAKMPYNICALIICASAPSAGDRITASGLEEILQMGRGGVPLMFVFTQCDTFVPSAIMDAFDDYTLNLTDEETQAYGEKKASEDFERLCVRLLTETVGGMALKKVSVRPTTIA